jgi:hypothetical protein
MVFLIAIQEESEGLNRSAIEQVIHSLGSWCHPLPSIWLVSAPIISAEAIWDELTPYFHPSDHLMVLPLHPDAPINNENWALPEISGWFTLNP